MTKVKFTRILLATTAIAVGLPGSAALGQTASSPATPTPENQTAKGVQAQQAAATQEDTTAAPADAAAATPAPSSGQEIVITGTLIRNPNLVSSAPVTVLGHDEIQLRQTNTAEEILRTIPGAAPSVGAQVNNGQTGSSFVNLRSLGSNRNIVLLDGVRIVPADLLGRVDLNNIPLALIDRVDVLTGGASSTYGADAIAGVINFITRSDFSGVELSVSDQITERGDGNYLRGDLTLGASFDDARGNAVMSLGYIESDPIYQGGDRPWSSLALNSTSPGDLSLSGSSTTVPSRFDIGGGRPNQQVSPDGVGIQNYYQPFNFNPYNVFQTPFKRYNFFSSAHYDIADHLTVYGRGLFSKNSVTAIIAPSGVFGNTVTVPVSNPFLSAAQRNYFCANALFNLPGGGTQRGITPAQCAAAATALTPTDPNYRTFSFGLRRRTTEIGPRITNYNTTVFDFRAGLRGDITDKIGFDVFGARGISDRPQTVQNFVMLSRVQQALLATNPTTCLTPTNGCVPLNVFGSEGSITPAMGSFLVQESSYTNHVVLSQGRATINGDTPLQLWGKAPVSFAVGGEYRKYIAKIRSDALAKTPGELGGAGGAQPDVTGGFDVYEGFAEMIAPLVSDRPFFNELQLEAGIRRSHYTLAAPGNPSFNTTTWKLAGTWAPVRDLKFRGAYNHAARAPNIAELFSSFATGLTNLDVDPCSGAAPTLNANLRNVCLAQGAPAAQIGAISNPTAGQANETVGGNVNLRPEIADTWTLGFVARPSFLPGFSASLDYYNIKINKAITIPTPGDLITACFGSNPSAPPPTAASSIACTAIRRNPITGALDGSPAEVPGLFAQYNNQGRITTDGFDATIDYRRNLGQILGSPAKLALNFAGNYTRSQKFQAVNVTSPANPTQSTPRECVGFYSANCGFPAGGLQPKYSFNERTTLSLGRVDLSLLWRYIHKMRYEPLLPPLFSGTIATTPVSRANEPGTFNGETVNFNRIPAANYFDFTTRFNVNEHFSLTLTVVNLFDKKPPIVGNTAGSTSQNSGNTFPSTYDPLGRRFGASARIKF